MNVFLTVFGLITFLFLGQLKSQVVFSEDFNGPVLPEQLIYKNEVDLGHEYGFEKSNFFRFHPRQERAVLELPALSLNGQYELSFAYSKNGFFDEDSIVVKVFKGDGNGFTRISSVKDDTKRLWKTATFDLGEISFDQVRIQFEFLGSGKYPAPYMGIENIMLRQTGIISGALTSFEDHGFNLLPNPSNGMFNLTVKAPTDEDLSLKVVNLEGKVIYQQQNINFKNQFPLDLTSSPNGIYQLLIYDEQNIFSKEFIITK